MKKRNVGILLPVFSLPGNHGIGDFSNYAYEFIDWLKERKYHYWQILPLNPVGPANSPYITVCSEAIDIRYISLDDLVEKGLLDKAPKYQANSTRVRYAERDGLWDARHGSETAPKTISADRLRREGRP